MKWATRPGVHVDRAACAWLIRRFIDPDAEFVFAADPGAVPGDATPFDIRGAALGHHQGRCSFETALEAFGLTTDPALEEIGHIVHEADLADERYDAPAAAGLDVLIRGLTLTSGSHTLSQTESVSPGPHGAWLVHYEIGGQQLIDYWFYAHRRWVFDLLLSNPGAVKLYRMSPQQYAAALGCNH